MLRVGIVGCGKIADSHAAQIQRIRDCEIVGVCDREPLMAQQLSERFPVGSQFCDVRDLLSVARPEVVHITTPPASHFDLARLCLEAGCHVYVEKPFTVDEASTHKLLKLANRHELKITAGHDDQFSHVARRMRALVERGYLGQGPVHLESYYCYELGQSEYGAAVIHDKEHWVRSLPGGLLQNVISHGIARIAEFLDGDAPTIIAYGFRSPFLRRLGEKELIDELRVVISDEERVTAYFTFSTQMRPALHQLRVYGSENGLVLDHDQETLIKLRGERFKSYAERFIPPVAIARQHLANLFVNTRTFLARDFHMKAGMKYLIESFYQAIREDGPVPIPHREIVLTARIMDEIFSQLAAGQAGDLGAQGGVPGAQSHRSKVCEVGEGSC